MNRILSTLALSAVLLGACADAPYLNHTDAPAGQDEFIEFVQDAWGTPEDAREIDIRWVDQDHISISTISYDLFGLYMDRPWFDRPRIYLVRPWWTDTAEEDDLTNSALTHELLHHHLWVTIGDSDSDHSRPEWDLVVHIDRQAWWSVECPLHYGEDACSTWRDNGAKW